MTDDERARWRRTGESADRPRAYVVAAAERAVMTPSGPHLDLDDRAAVRARLVRAAQHARRWGLDYAAWRAEVPAGLAEQLTDAEARAVAVVVFGER